MGKKGRGSKRRAVTTEKGNFAEMGEEFTKEILNENNEETFGKLENL